MPVPLEEVEIDDVLLDSGNDTVIACVIDPDDRETV